MLWYTLEASHTTASGGASPKAMGGLVDMFYVYILKSEIRDRYYIGYTSDVAERVRKHNAGSTTSTRPHKPWKVVYVEECADKKSAWLRERQIKQYKSGEAFKKLLEN